MLNAVAVNMVHLRRKRRMLTKNVITAGVTTYRTVPYSDAVHVQIQILGANCGSVVQRLRQPILQTVLPLLLSL